MGWIKQRINNTHRILDVDYSAQMINFKELIRRTIYNNGKIIFAGNGASNTIATHAALDYANQLKVKTVCFNDSGMITAFSNDYGYDYSLVKYLSINLDKKDLLVLISSSGESENIIKACEYAIEKGNDIVSFTGFGRNNRLAKISGLSFWVDSDQYNIVESIHNMLISYMCDFVAGENP